jgi:hypothetical protein
MLAIALFFVSAIFKNKDNGLLSLALAMPPAKL